MRSGARPPFTSTCPSLIVVQPNKWLCSTSRRCPPGSASSRGASRTAASTFSFESLGRARSSHVRRRKVAMSWANAMVPDNMVSSLTSRQRAWLLGPVSARVRQRPVACRWPRPILQNADLRPRRPARADAMSSTTLFPMSPFCRADISEAGAVPKPLDSRHGAGGVAKAGPRGPSTLRIGACPVHSRRCC